ncbi:unnamed protein product [Closterium sp. NIES-53]
MPHAAIGTTSPAAVHSVGPSAVRSADRSVPATSQPSILPLPLSSHDARARQVGNPTTTGPSGDADAGGAAGTLVVAAAGAATTDGQSAPLTTAGATADASAAADSSTAAETAEAYVAGVPEQCSMQRSTDYDGEALTWGLDFHTASAADCCARCRAMAATADATTQQGGAGGQQRCNIWVFCPEPGGFPEQKLVVSNILCRSVTPGGSSHAMARQGEGGNVVTRSVHPNGRRDATQRVPSGRSTRSASSQHVPVGTQSPAFALGPPLASTLNVDCLPDVLKASQSTGRALTDHGVIDAENGPGLLAAQARHKGNKKAATTRARALRPRAPSNDDNIQKAQAGVGEKPETQDGVTAVCGEVGAGFEGTAKIGRIAESPDDVWRFSGTSEDSVRELVKQGRAAEDAPTVVAAEGLAASAAAADAASAGVEVRQGNGLNQSLQMDDAGGYEAPTDAMIHVGSPLKTDTGRLEAVGEGTAMQEESEEQEHQEEHGVTKRRRKKSYWSRKKRVRGERNGVASSQTSGESEGGSAMVGVARNVLEKRDGVAEVAQFDDTTAVGDADGAVGDADGVVGMQGNEEVAERKRGAAFRGSDWKYVRQDAVAARVEGSQGETGVERTADGEGGLQKVDAAVLADAGGRAPGSRKKRRKLGYRPFLAVKGDAGNDGELKEGEQPMEVQGEGERVKGMVGWGGEQGLGNTDVRAVDAGAAGESRGHGQGTEQEEAREETDAEDTNVREVWAGLAGRATSEVLPETAGEVPLGDGSAGEATSFGGSAPEVQDSDGSGSWGRRETRRRATRKAQARRERQGAGQSGQMRRSPRLRLGDAVLPPLPAIPEEGSGERDESPGSERTQGNAGGAGEREEDRANTAAAETIVLSPDLGGGYGRYTGEHEEEVGDAGEGEGQGDAVVGDTGLQADSLAALAGGVLGEGGAGDSRDGAGSRVVGGKKGRKKGKKGKKKVKGKNPSPAVAAAVADAGAGGVAGDADEARGEGAEGDGVELVVEEEDDDVQEVKGFAVAEEEVSDGEADAAAAAGVAASGTGVAAAGATATGLDAAEAAAEEAAAAEAAVAEKAPAGTAAAGTATGAATGAAAAAAAAAADAVASAAEARASLSGWGVEGTGCEACEIFKQVVQVLEQQNRELEERNQQLEVGPMLARTTALSCMPHATTTLCFDPCSSMREPCPCNGPSLPPSAAIIAAATVIR